jgi:RimJ/RimL family protein N-acetyltransferase
MSSAGSGDAAVIAETGRVVLRPWQLDEADRFLEIYQHPEVVQWFQGGPMADRRAALDSIESNLARLAVDPRFGRWAVVDRTIGRPVGTVILQPLPDGDGEVEIGWHLHPSSWGRGLASEAARVVLARGFAHGLEEVWAVTDPNNRRSIAVCGRIGMRLLGVTTRWYHETSFMFWAGAQDDQQPTIAPEAPADV